jgi:3-amino-4-hydroxybenzoic acid synthase
VEEADSQVEAVTPGATQASSEPAMAASRGTTSDAGTSWDDHLVWIDLRECPADQRPALLQATINHGLDGVVLPLGFAADIPPTLSRIAFGGMAPEGGETAPEGDQQAQITVVPDDDYEVAAPQQRRRLATQVDVTDAASLELACRRAASEPWTVLSFADPTKIPLEIVIAAANNADGRTVTQVHSLDEAAVVFGCLERGSDGVMMAPSSLDDVVRIAELRAGPLGNLVLCEVVVTETRHIGMGDRACLDTCTMLEKDEGMLVGSFSRGLLLTCSETHPLPYMPTRPFRINAGAVHSYVLTSPKRTSYLTELGAGTGAVTVRVDGSIRRVFLGRIKIERRPLLSICAAAPDGRMANIIVQDDWHVRLLGPRGVVRNVTELQPGDKLLAYLPGEARHVGYPIAEFCIEQ